MAPAQPKIHGDSIRIYLRNQCRPRSKDHGQGGASREAMMKNGSGDGGDACERRRDWEA
jgi:hypothetical protein